MSPLRVSAISVFEEHFLDKRRGAALMGPAAGVACWPRSRTGRYGLFQKHPEPFRSVQRRSEAVPAELRGRTSRAV